MNENYNGRKVKEVTIYQMRIILLFSSIMIILLLFACSSNRAFFSADNLEYEEVVDLYKNIPAFRDDQVNDFIIHLENPAYPKSARKSESQGIVYCQPLIDEEGNIVAIIINESFDLGCSYTSIEAIKKSKFKSLAEVTGKVGKYSLLIRYSFGLRIPNKS